MILLTIIMVPSSVMFYLSDPGLNIIPMTNTTETYFTDTTIANLNIKYLIPPIIYKTEND